MKTDYVSIGTYPEMTGRECTSGTSKDGTPFNAKLLDDLWGFIQAATSQGNVIPSENSEAYSASDILNGIRHCTGSPGDVVYSCANYATLQAKGIRLLFAIGQLVLISEYPLLAEYCYVGDSENGSANAFYKANSSGVRSTSGDYIKIPDLRHVFIRGWNDGNSEFYRMDDAIKEHSHEITSPGTGSLVGKVADIYSGDIDHRKMMVFLEESTGNPRVYASEFEDSNANETRPVCINARAYIRY